MTDTDSTRITIAPPLNSAERDTLVALVEGGPLFDGDVPSKTGRDLLLRRGLAVKVVVRGEDGYQAATYQGREAYKLLFGGADSIAAAKANRLAQRAIDRAGARG